MNRSRRILFVFVGMLYLFSSATARGPSAISRSPSAIPRGHSAIRWVPYAILRIKAGGSRSNLLLQRFDQYGVDFRTDTILFTPRNPIIRRIVLPHPEEIGLNVYGHKTIRLWLRPGDDLTIDLRDGNPQFTGTAARFARYFVEEQVFWSKLFDEYKIRNAGFDEDSTRFNDRYFLIEDSITLARIKFLEDYFCETSAVKSNEFVKSQKQELIYANLYYKLAFDGADIRKFRCCPGKPNSKGIEYYAFSGKPVFCDPLLLRCGYYREFVALFLMEIARARLRVAGVRWSFDAYADSAMRVADELAGGSERATDLKSIFLNSLVDEIGRRRKLAYYAKTDEILRAFGNNSGTRIRLIREKFEKILLDTRFDRGCPAPDFILTDTAGRTYTLKDFAGKKIYLDVNASWCGPCLASIPAWNKRVEENTNHSQVVFISVCLDEDETKWRSLLKTHSIKGILLYAGKGGFASNFARDYHVTAIPHFILLDKGGKIAEYTAPGPGEDEISTILAQ